MEQKSKKTFELVDFIPIGFKVKNYPTKICPLCRGYLTSVCYNCSDRNDCYCPIISKDNVYFHRHCYNFFQMEGNK